VTATAPAGFGSLSRNAPRRASDLAALARSAPARRPTMYPDPPRRPRRDPDPRSRPPDARRSWQEPGSGRPPAGGRRPGPAGGSGGAGAAGGSWRAAGQGRGQRNGQGQGDGRRRRPADPAGRDARGGRDRRDARDPREARDARRQAAPWAGAAAGAGAAGAGRRPPGRYGGQQYGQQRYGEQQYGAGDRDGGGGRRRGDDGYGGYGGGGGRGYDGPGRRRRRRSWLQRGVLTAGVVVALVCLLGASVAGYTLVKYESIDRVDVPTDAAAKGEPKNFLVVAVDGREGHETRNTDTIMVVRVDPQSDRVALTSFPRDLMVTIADTGKVGMINSAYSRDSGGEQVLIETIQQNFDIPIHHFVEVNFQSFRQVVDAVGGVPIYVPYAIRDNHSGLGIDDLGCVTLNGEQGLAFARSRYLQIMTQDGWDQDPYADVNRVQRQQLFIQGAMSKAVAQVRSNPLRLPELVDIGVANVRLDGNLTIDNLIDLANKFKDFDSDELETYPLPTSPYPQDENRLMLDEAAAEPMLNVFRGLAAGEIRPGLINVSVLNGTTADPAQEREGLAGDVSAALQKIGFKMAPADDADEFYATTTIFHAPGQESYGQRVARHITSQTAVPMQVDADLRPGEVRVVAGLDFNNVHDQPTPIDEMPAAAGAEATPTTAVAGEQPSTPPAPEVTTTTQPSPYVVGAPPEGVSCGGG
jgi:polyisoprenyl-teichoic acid--peptidoglycan teichoic acid transferase